MANNYFKEQYENSPQIRRGIDTILKSNNYTDEYKTKIRTYLEGIDVDLFSKEDSLSVSPSMMPSRITVSSRKGSSGGYIEKPGYIEDEIKRALDVIVDELITLPPEQRPETVLKSKYDELLDLYRKSVADFTDLTDLYNTALSDIENLKLEIESLNQVVDAQKLLTAVANNEADAANSRYASLLGDFQSALQKGIQEAIERVSLEAQVRGLQAQKEVLKTLVDSLQNTVEQQQQQQAASFSINSRFSGKGQSGLTGWQVDPVGKPQDFDKGQVLRYEDDDGRSGWINGPNMTLFNATDTPVLFTVGITVSPLGESHTRPWIGTNTNQTGFEVPAREGSNAGQLIVPFRLVNNVGRGNNNDFKDDVKFTGNNGDSFTIQANYFYDS